MARIPIQHFVLSMGKTLVVFFIYFIPYYYITFTGLMLIYWILMPVSSIGYYRVFALNLRDSHIFILDSTTPGTVYKEEQMKQYSCALK
jgi:hypothetical protein